MSQRNTVSVVIPVYNGERFVGDAIRSVLDQSARPLECIVVDDGSADSTRAVVESFGSAVRYEYQENSGVSRARNRGVELARCDLVAFLDHDDVWLPRKLESQLEALDGSGATMVLCGMVVVDASGEVIGHKRLHASGNLLTGLLTFDGTESVSCSSSGLIERKRFEALGGFDPNLSTSADLDLLIRVLLTGNVRYVSDELVRYRVHGTNMSRSVSATERDMIYLLGKVFSDPQLPAYVRSCRRRAYGGVYRMLSGSYWEAGSRVAALRTFAAAVKNDPSLAVHEWRRRTRAPVGAGEDSSPSSRIS
jgi:glycosyltransferase involved in cell wall biosynthesis